MSKNSIEIKSLIKSSEQSKIKRVIKKDNKVESAEELYKKIELIFSK